ncbi:hypothetical protein [Corynebacterium variabile]|uniref:hypothetical protein n=1 Tax=Corynebacterium variabile TaxID=1727 RepID=UPI003A91BFB3
MSTTSSATPILCVSSALSAVAALICGGLLVFADDGGDSSVNAASAPMPGVEATSTTTHSTELPSDASGQEHVQFNPDYITKWIGAGGVLKLFPDGTGTMYRNSGNTDSISWDITWVGSGHTVNFTLDLITSASGDRMTHIPDLADGGTGNRYTATISDDGSGLVAVGAPLCRTGIQTCTQAPQ